MATIFASLIPIMLIIGAGAGLTRFSFYGQEFRRGLNRLVYWVALPSLFVASLSGASFATSGVDRLIAVAIGSMVAAGALAFATAWLWKLPATQVGVFTQAGLRGNLVFLGLPVLMLIDRSLVEPAVLVIAPLVIAFNLISVAALLLPHHAMGLSALPRLIRPVLTNPLVISCGIGAGLALLDWRLWGPLETAMRLVGDTAAPLALLSLGGALIDMPVKGRIGPAAGASVIKIAVYPLVTWGLAGLAGLSPQHALIAMVLGACPTGVASYVLASQLKGDTALAAACVLVSTALSMPVLAWVLWTWG